MVGLNRIFAGLSISAGHLALVILQRHGSVLGLKAVHTLDLPAGLVSPSPAKPNIADPGLLAERVRELLKPYRGVKAISVALPDPSVRATVLAADGRLLKGQDLEQLVRWQMEKKFLSSLSDTKVAYQLLPGPGNGILGIAIQHQILGGYEEAVRMAGVEPVGVGVSSLQLFNFYHDLMLEQAGAAGRFIVLNVFEGNFTLMILMGGVVDFIRIKGIQASSGGARIMGSVDGNLTDMIMQELNRSLGFYSQGKDPSEVTHLFVFGRGISELIKKAHDRYRVEVEPLEPQRLKFLRGVEQVRPEEVPYLTPAIAAAWGRSRN